MKDNRTQSSHAHQSRVGYVGPQRTSTSLHAMTFTGKTRRPSAIWRWLMHTLSTQNVGNRPWLAWKFSATSFNAFHFRAGGSYSHFESWNKKEKKKRRGKKKVEGQMSRHSSPARFLKPTPDGIKKNVGSHITVKSKDFPRLCRGADQECETKKSMISPRPTGRESSYPVPWLCIQSSSVCAVQSTWRGVSISRSKSDLLTNPTQRFQ